MEKYDLKINWKAHAPYCDKQEKMADDVEHDQNHHWHCDCEENPWCCARSDMSQCFRPQTMIRWKKIHQRKIRWHLLSSSCIKPFSWVGPPFGTWLDWQSASICRLVWENWFCHCQQGTICHTSANSRRMRWTLLYSGYHSGRVEDTYSRSWHKFQSTSRGYCHPGCTNGTILVTDHLPYLLRLFSDQLQLLVSQHSAVLMLEVPKVNILALLPGPFVFQSLVEMGALVLFIEISVFVPVRDIREVFSSLRRSVFNDLHTLDGCNPWRSKHEHLVCTPERPVDMIRDLMKTKKSYSSVLREPQSFIFSLNRWIYAGFWEVIRTMCDAWQRKSLLMS